ncbi:hypothetical protein HK100_008263 [Physocladia obscura]|uniref:HTH APSES-type domain-containing protein n=1 Tax=Physocladia obscura TaxID=109957 RepID=A0AAD5XMY8_9FUNG|nr:hypothetical protein HK100_008263 [Physocladia obscura]
MDQHGLITPATYSGVNVLQQADAYGLPVMRRAKDDYINATQVLRAAGFPKTQRTKILERDISGGVHEKVQGGFHMFQGTWVPLDTAIRLARKHNVNELLTPLFSFTLDSGAESEIFKTMEKVAKPYRIPRARPPGNGTENLAAARPARASAAATNFLESDSDDDDLLDYLDDTDEEFAALAREGGAVGERSIDSFTSGSGLGIKHHREHGEDDERARALTSRRILPHGANSSSGEQSASENEFSAIHRKKFPSNNYLPSSPNPNTPSFNSHEVGNLIDNTPAATPPLKRGPGRPKGSKNRANSGSPAPLYHSTGIPRVQNHSSTVFGFNSASPEQNLQNTSVRKPADLQQYPQQQHQTKGRGRPRGSRSAAITAATTTTATIAAIGSHDNVKLSLVQQHAFAKMNFSQVIERDTSELMDPYGVLDRHGVSGQYLCSDSDISENDADNEDFGCDMETAAGGVSDVSSLVGGDEELSGVAVEKRTHADEEDAVESLRNIGNKRFKDSSFATTAQAIKIRNKRPTKKFSACISCGTVTVSKWKRLYRNDKKGVLCDLCGFKTCFSANSSKYEESDGNETDDGLNEILDEVPESAEIIALKTQLEESERGSKKMKRLLESLKREDAGVDRAFRRTIIWCRRVKQGNWKGLPTPPSSIVTLVPFAQMTEDGCWKGKSLLEHDAQQPLQSGNTEKIEDESVYWDQEVERNFVGTVLKNV